jgi:hypothetical protein
MECILIRLEKWPPGFPGAIFPGEAKCTPYRSRFHTNKIISVTRELFHQPSCFRYRKSGVPGEAGYWTNREYVHTVIWLSRWVPAEAGTHPRPNNGITIPRHGGKVDLGLQTAIEKNNPLRRKSA